MNSMDSAKQHERTTAKPIPAAVAPPDDPAPSWWGRRAWDLFTLVRARAPLVQCITNFVSMDLVANTLLAVGASPAMVHCLEEISDFTPRADSLYVNIGTLSGEWLPSMCAAAAAAARSGKPWVLDPVAVFVSDFRMEACRTLVERRPAVIRGNPSEIIALASATRQHGGKGVDSSDESLDAVEAAKSLAQRTGSIVAVSGATDFVTDGQRTLGAHNGDPMMQKITATGCTVTALIAAFVAVDSTNILEATVCALSIFGLAGELGKEIARGPASLRMHMIDSLHGLDEHTVSARVKISLMP